VSFVRGGASQLLAVGMGFPVRWKRGQARQLLVTVVVVDSVIHGSLSGTCWFQVMEGGRLVRWEEKRERKKMNNEGNGLKGLPREREARKIFDDRDVRRGMLQAYGHKSMFPFLS